MAAAKFETLCEQVRRHSQESVLRACAAASSVISFELLREPGKLEVLRQEPWALSQIGRLAVLAGTDFNRDPVSTGAFGKLRQMHNELPAEGSAVEPGQLLSLLAHEQLLIQLSPRLEWSRSWLLAHSDAIAGEKFDWTAEFGAGVDAAVKVVHGLSAVLFTNSGVIPRDWADDVRMGAIVQACGGVDQFRAVLGALSGSVDSLRQRALEAAGVEQIKDLKLARDGFNPLVSTPLVETASGDYICPSVPLLTQALFPANLYYRGAARWGEQFTNAMGDRHESYVGEQLRSVPGATVYPEIVFNKGQDKSVDWIVVFDECVLLVEAKNARMTLRALHEAAEAGNLLDRTVGKAAEQLEKTAQKIEDRHPAFAKVPSDRPIYGVAVTAEEMVLANLDGASYLGRLSFPAETVPARALEALACLDAATAGARVSEYFKNVPAGADALEMYLVRGQRLTPNPLLDDAWTHLEIPVQ